MYVCLYTSHQTGAYPPPLNLKLKELGMTYFHDKLSNKLLVTAVAMPLLHTYHEFIGRTDLRWC
jgi:hypothetical protein